MDMGFCMRFIIRTEAGEFALFYASARELGIAD